MYKSNQSHRRRRRAAASFFHDGLCLIVPHCSVPSFSARAPLFSLPFLPLGSSGLVCYADANSEEQRLIAPSRQRTNTNEQEKASSFIRFGRHDTVRARFGGKSTFQNGILLPSNRMAAPSSPPCAPSSLYLSFPLFFVHVLKEDREAAAVSSRPKSSPESPSFLLLNGFLPLLLHCR